MKASTETRTPLAGSLRGLVIRIACWWSGHELTNAYNDGWRCERCATHLSYDEAAAVVFPMRDRIRWWPHKIKEWWRCRDCGRYCGRHDNTVDHIPF